MKKLAGFCIAILLFSCKNNNINTFKNNEKISVSGFAIPQKVLFHLKKYEGYSPYIESDGAHCLVIGYGYNISSLPYPTIELYDGYMDRQEAEFLLKKEILGYFIKFKSIKPSATDNECLALSLLSFRTSFSTVLKSRLFRLFKALENKRLVSARFLKYNRMTGKKTGKKVINKKLKERAEFERQLFLENN